MQSQWYVEHGNPPISKVMLQNYPLWSPRRSWPTSLLLHWIVLIDFVHLDTVEINTQNFHGLIDTSLQIHICIALKDDGVPVENQSQLVFSGVTKIFFHSISFLLYFPAQKTSSVLLLMDKNSYIHRQQFIHTANKELHLCFELCMIFSCCVLKSLFWYCYGLTFLGKAQELYRQVLPVP